MSTDLRFDDTPPHGQQAVLGAPTPDDGPVRVTREHRATRNHVSGRVFNASRGPRFRPRHRRRWIVLGVLGALVLLVVGVVAWFDSEANPSGHEGSAVIVAVRSGESTDTVVGTLARKGVVDSSLAFRLWSFVHGAPTIQPGSYQLRKNSSFSTVRARLAAGPNVYELDVEPGMTLAEVANRLSTVPGKLAQTFFSDAKTGAVASAYQTTHGGSLEGLIAAGQYKVTPHESAQTLLHEMITRFDSEAASAGLTPTTSVGGLTAYDAVVVASIAQKEGYFTRYIGDVARVVYNRLADGMHLDMTSTVLYSLGQDGGPVTPQEEETTSPYNTYLHSGLTPTPICTPSETALAAAASPPAGSWLYFELVTAEKGTMVFSSTFTAQIAAEREAAANAAAHKAAKSRGTGPGATGGT
ncbi:MAG: endolytic transglycosylase MltG [Acidimicrobiales bacterium]